MELLEKKEALEDKTLELMSELEYLPAATQKTPQKR
jgi:hypothetical protein